MRKLTFNECLQVILSLEGLNYTNEPGDNGGPTTAGICQSTYSGYLKNHNQALSLAERLNVKLAIVQSLRGLGDTYFKQDDFKTAIDYLRLAIL